VLSFGQGVASAMFRRIATIGLTLGVALLLVAIFLPVRTYMNILTRPRELPTDAQGLAEILGVSWPRDTTIVKAARVVPVPGETNIYVKARFPRKDIESFLRDNGFTQDVPRETRYLAGDGLDQSWWDPYTHGSFLSASKVLVEKENLCTLRFLAALDDPDISTVYVRKSIP
jgi:hypothetical protein